MSDTKIKTAIRNVKKRSGTVTEFDKTKISNAIYKAMEVCRVPDKKTADRLASKVVNRMSREGYSETIVPDWSTSKTWWSWCYWRTSTARSPRRTYCTGRTGGAYATRRCAYWRPRRWIPSPAASRPAACGCWPSRYLFRDSKSRIIETPTRLFERVAVQVGLGDILYDPTLFERDGSHSQDTVKAESYMEKLDNFDNSSASASTTSTSGTSDP